MDIVYLVSNAFDSFVLMFGLMVAIAGICFLRIAVSLFDYPLIRKYFLSGKFSLRTMFTLNTVVALDIAFLRWMDVQFHSTFDNSVAIVLAILLVTPGSYVVVSLITICLQDMFVAKSKNKMLNPTLPETVAISTPIVDKPPEPSEINVDFLTKENISAVVAPKELIAEKVGQNLSIPNEVAKYSGGSTASIHPT